MATELEYCSVFSRQRHGLSLSLFLVIGHFVLPAWHSVAAFTQSSSVGGRQQFVYPAEFDCISGKLSSNLDSRHTHSHKLLLSSNRTPRTTTSCRQAAPEDSDSRTIKSTQSLTDLDNTKNGGGDEYFDMKMTVALVGGQSALVPIAAVVGGLIGTPNFGLGPNIDFSGPAIQEGLLWTIPLGVIAYVLDFFEDRFPALQDTSRATQQSVLTLLGGTFKPVVGLVTAASLGLAAGLGEEMFFRGVLQSELLNRFGSEAFALGASSIVFGAVHAVTPLYAIIASLAGVYFGWLYLSTDNLAVPIATHAFYDLVAFLCAHYDVAKLDKEEQRSLAKWTSPMYRKWVDDGTE